MSNQATYDDANLILRLYELRRETKLRQAREWFSMNFKPASLEDMQRLAPPGSQENAYVRMVVSYWDMAAAFVTSGVLSQELFFQTSRELLFVWERVRELVPGIRAFTKDPCAWQNLETVGNAFIKMLEARGPEAYATFQGMVRGVTAPEKS